MSAGIYFNFITRYGNPLSEIIAELRHGDYDLLVVGGKMLEGIDVFRSWNLPAKLARHTRTGSIMTVRALE